MNEDLQIEYSILMKDVSALPNTTSTRYSIDEYGILHLADKADASTEEERARRVLGAIFPLFTAKDVGDELRKSTRSGLSFHASNYKKIKVLEKIDRKCITDNFDVRLILLLLRYERVIEFNRTPLCQGEYPEDYLDHLISSSEIPYKDTLQALLHEQSGNLIINDAGGLSVLTSWAAGKFSSSSIAKFFEEEGINDKVKCRKLCIPGKVAVLKAELEAKLPGCEIIVAPREAVQLVKFLKDMQ